MFCGKHLLAAKRRRSNINARAALRARLLCRGNMENLIKKCHLDRSADHTGAATTKGNQLRPWFASMTYVLLSAQRRKAWSMPALPRTKCARIKRHGEKFGPSGLRMRKGKAVRALRVWR